MPEVIPGSRTVHGPEDETSRETLRVGRRCSLVVVEGTVQVVGKRGEDLAIAAPAVVSWWPGEDVVYRGASADARWLFMPSTLINPPMDYPAIGSLVRVTPIGSGPVHEGTVVGYAGDSASLDEDARFVTVDSDATGVSIVDLRDNRIILLDAPSSGF